MPAGANVLLEKMFDAKIDSTISWFKKKWYTRLLSIILVPVLIILGIVILIWIYAPLCVLAEALYIFPGKLIYWVAKGKFPERESLFRPWEKKSE